MNRAPVRHTCPDIDKVIAEIKDAISSAKYIERDCEDLYDAKSEADHIGNCLWWLEDQLEDLRNSNSALREWGEELTFYLEEAENKNSELEQEIDNLKDEIENLQTYYND